MSLARRGLFGLAAGGVATLAGARGSSNARNYPRPPAMSWASQGIAETCGEYVESAARKLLNAKIEESNLSHERKIRRLSRLKSISQAFVDAQYMGHNNLMNSLYKQLSDAP